MTGNSRTLNSTPVLAVILTHERPAELQRCVQTAFATLCSDDFLVVLDDSSPEQSRANARSLEEAARTSRSRFCYVNAERAQAEIGRALGSGKPQWLRRTAQRDISPLRNLALLISVAVGPETTVLLDDDICGFDLNRTHQVCKNLESGPAGLIAGAKIGSLTDLDTITRISIAVRLAASTDILDHGRNMYQGQSGDDGGALASGCVSAGYMAFRLPTPRLFAFPPGYNEDWLWCLLQKATGTPRILRTDEEVLHDPLRLRIPTRDDLHFETTGDIIFDCFVECNNNGRFHSAELALSALSDLTPDRSALPIARAEALIARLQELPDERRANVVRNLRDSGLGILQEMLTRGELEVEDGRTILNNWILDAVDKHRSFAATIGAPDVISTVRRRLASERE